MDSTAAPYLNSIFAASYWFVAILASFASRFSSSASLSTLPNVLRSFKKTVFITLGIFHR
ncbi:hypothetical protein B0H14DRAFT_3456235 [Mycena olivaceomarginata]|nr:hypothetical protein B0H14DRAFT_3456235 [Mycena olivaceomarginata]